MGSSSVTTQQELFSSSSRESSGAEARAPDASSPTAATGIRSRPAARCWLIGESNPYGPDPHYALYHEPPHASGGRLQRLVLRVDWRTYLSLFHRRDTVVGPWRAKAAREGAERIWAEIPADHAVVLLGRKVWEAWCPLVKPESPRAAWEPFAVIRSAGKPTVATIPHPSGLNRAWHAQGSFDRARATVQSAAPWLADILGTLSC